MTSARRVGAGQPILAGRTEHIHIERVLERECPVRHVRGDHEHLPGTRRELALIVVAKPELQRPRENVGQLLVLMLVARHVIAFLQIHVRDHHALARDQAAGDRALEGFLWDALPTMMGHAVEVRGHD
jgi:hypothetical protein